MNKYLAGAVLTVGILVSPLFASASGLTSLQIQAILSLLQSFGADATTIANVTTSLSGGTPSSTSQAWCHTFTSDLTVGSNGDEVAALNQALQSSNIDTSGNTSYFSENTAGDVISFQSHYGIRQSGYVGPLTRAKLNALYGCHGNQMPVMPPTPSVAPSARPTSDPSLTVTATPTITSIAPTSAKTGDQVTLLGTNFSSSFTDISIDGGMYGASATVVSSTQLTFVIPYDTDQWKGVPSGTHTVQAVNIGNGIITGERVELKSNSVPLQIVPKDQKPQILRTSTATGGNPKQGDTVDIYGANFDSRAEVLINASVLVPATYISPTHISFVVPTNVWNSVMLEVRLHQDTRGYASTDISNPVSLTISGNTAGTPTSAPIIVTIVSSEGVPGQGRAYSTGTLYGSNLSGATGIEFFTSSGSLRGTLTPNSTSLDGKQTSYVLDGGFESGTYTIKVVTPAGESNAMAFTILPNYSVLPHIDAVTAGSNGSLNIVGSHLELAKTIYLGNCQGNWIPLTSFTTVLEASGGSLKLMNAALVITPYCRNMVPGGLSLTINGNGNYGPASNTFDADTSNWLLPYAKFN